jgi:multidrug efflux pump subunit AcrA (membrane-fusion protein)
MSASFAGRLFHAVGQVVRVLFARLRFVFVLGAIALVILKWDELAARYERWAHRHDDHAGADPDHEYFCPMHPSIVRDTNKEKCPICFMPLSKRAKGEVTDDPLPAGIVSRMQLSPYRVVLAGVRTVPVEYLALTRDLTTVGNVEFDERLLKTVSARVKGRIEKLHVDQTGQMVHGDDALAELYSPDLVVTVQNLLDARKTGGKDLEENARERLRRWGIDDPQIDQIVASGKPITQLTVRSPIKGHVLKKYVREGQYVEEGSPLFDVADLATVWVQAQLYEDDLAFLPAGGHDPTTGKPGFELKVTAFARAFPNRAFAGSLSFLFPHVDPQTRTLTARFEVGNKDHELRPGMTATVTLKFTPELLAGTPAGSGLQVRDGKVLAVPESSVIDTGSQKVVYRESLPNTFEGVTVALGSRMHTPGGAVYYPVVSGLNADDRVVTAGSFLIDAETRLNPAAASVYSGSAAGKGGGPAVRPTTPDDMEAKITAALAKLAPADRKQAVAQKYCPIQEEPLGSMGVPILTDLGNGRSVWVCCKGCIPRAQKDPDGTLRKLEEFRTHPPRSGGQP